jgi:MATE family multidrug resistance protein
MNFHSTSLYKRHFAGPGGISALLPIAIPMILSSIFDTAMMFVDRLFLAHVGKLEQAAAMSGGTTSWMAITMFAGIVSYSSTIVAHHYGADQKTECPKVVYQAFRIALLSYPVVLVISWLASHTFSWARHAPEQQSLELTYFWYMAFAGICPLIRSAFASFFSGIGKTRIIMVASAIACMVNIIANYVLIFGKFGFPAMGLVGAAIGTVLSSISMAAIIGIEFFRLSRKAPFASPKPYVFNLGGIKRIIRYGFANGLENLLGMVSFVVITVTFHSFGEDIAAATTITFNWDGVAFFPLLGIQIGVSTLVGQNMGAKNPDGAEQAAYSGFKLALLYSGAIVILFCTATKFLVGLFTPDVPGIDYTVVKDIAFKMLRLAAFYIMSDSIYVVAAGALRGAGDTFKVMLISTIFHWINASAICLSVYYFKFSHLTTWAICVVGAAIGGFIILARFKLGHWKELNLLED